MYLVYYNYYDGEFHYREGELAELALRSLDGSKRYRFNCTDGKRPSYLLRTANKPMILDSYDRLLINDLSQFDTAKIIITDALIAKKRDKIEGMRHDLNVETEKLNTLIKLKTDISHDMS